MLISAGVLSSPFVRPKINFWWLLGRMYFSVFGVYWLVTVVPPSHNRSFGINTLAGFSRQVFEESRLRGKVFILLSLRDVPPPGLAPGWEEVLVGNGKQLWVGSYQLAPMETKAVRINEIVEKQVLDAKGTILSKDILTGQVAW
jgi:hypothetical protein